MYHMIERYKSICRRKILILSFLFNCPLFFLNLIGLPLSPLFWDHCSIDREGANITHRRASTSAPKINMTTKSKTASPSSFSSEGSKTQQKQREHDHQQKKLMLTQSALMKTPPKVEVAAYLCPNAPEVRHCAYFRHLFCCCCIVYS
jgi:hypothetical protein